MKTNNISFESLVSQLVTVFKSADMLADYNSEAVQHEVFSGWTGGSMSPISRPAYLQEFGKETLEAAEKVARTKIEEEKAEFEKGEFFAASLAADKVREMGGDGSRSRGSRESVVGCVFCCRGCPRASNSRRDGSS